MAGTHFSITSVGFWKAYWVHMRPYLLFVSGSAGLTGIAAAPIHQIPGLWILLAFLPLFLSYGFGQALTDCFQVDTDRLSAPYRPLSQGSVSKKSIMTVSLLGLLLGVGLLISLNPWNMLLGSLAILGLSTYTIFKRNYWYAGPFYNAWIVALLPIMGYISILRVGLTEHINSLLPIMALNFFAYTNFVLMGYLKDISADRATGYRTFPVVFGWVPTVWVGDFLVLLSAIIAAALTFSHPAAKIVWALATLIAATGQIYAHLTSDKSETNAARSITATVRSFILWHIAVILSVREDWWPWLLVFYLVVVWTLRNRPSQNQI